MFYDVPQIVIISLGYIVSPDVEVIHFLLRVSQALVLLYRPFDLFNIHFIMHSF
jgi:hypothetical protein